jgi:hypothetical protein
MEFGAAEPPQVPSPVPLYSPRQIVVASFLGAPIAAAWLVSKNYRALGRPDRAVKIIWLGVLATMIVLVVAFLLPDRVPNTLWPLMYSSAIYGYVSWVFGPVTQRHYASGGARGSWGNVIGIGVTCALIVLALMLVLIFAFPDD